MRPPGGQSSLESDRFSHQSMGPSAPIRTAASRRLSQFLTPSRGDSHVVGMKPEHLAGLWNPGGAQGELAAWPPSAAGQLSLGVGAPSCEHTWKEALWTLRQWK